MSIQALSQEGILVDVTLVVERKEPESNYRRVGRECDQKNRDGNTDVEAKIGVLRVSAIVDFS